MIRTSTALEAIALVRSVLDPPADRVHEEREGPASALPTRVLVQGFSWWPHALEQRVSARMMPAHDACIVSASTRILQGVDERSFAALAEWNAREPGLSSLRWHSAADELSLRAAVIVRPGDVQAPARRLAHAALLQLGESLVAADALSLALPGATLAESGPPRRTAVEQVEAARAYAQGGATASVGIAERVAGLASGAPERWRRTTAAAHGVDLEIAIEEDVALLRVSASQPHPRLGPGLLLALVLPARFEPEPGRAAALAALLQEGETYDWTGADAIGGWCVHAAAGLSHVTFVPALAVEEDTVDELARQAVLRAQWATRFLLAIREQKR